MLAEQWADFSKGKVRFLPRPKKKWGEKYMPWWIEVLILVITSSSLFCVFTAVNSLCCLLVGMHANFLASCVSHNMNIIFQAEPTYCDCGYSPLQISWDFISIKLKVEKRSFSSSTAVVLALWPASYFSAQHELPAWLGGSLFKST